MVNSQKHRQPSVLVVDDDPTNLHLLTNYLGKVGFKVLPIKHSEQVFYLLEKQKPDIILLDILMPGIDGFELCRRLKARNDTHEIPIIFMSALTETVDKVKGFQTGAVDYITKPVQLEEVLARIQTHLTIQTLQQRLQDRNRLLAKEKIRCERLSEATFEGIAIQNEGRIIEVNAALVNLFGYQRTEIVGKPFLEIIAPEKRDAVRHHMLIENRTPHQTCGLKKDGSTFFIEIQTKMMPYQEQNDQVVAIRDMTWRKEMEAKTAQLERENIELRANIKEGYKLGHIIGKSPQIQEIYERILNSAASDAHVAIYGESGTGKELIARTIHEHSPRHIKEFVTVNCGAIPDSLFESEFFGYRKGAFTGADKDKPGFFDLAHQGTLFLDEVGELSPTEQVKLLRAVETGEYTPLGSNKSKNVDVRIMAATHRNVTELRRQGLLRDDFFYRIHVVTITVPPLRERKEDIPLLLDYFLKQSSKNPPYSTLPGKIVESLYAYDWPGNVRELRNVLSRYLAGQSIEFDGSASAPLPLADIESETQPLREAIDQFERQSIIIALNKNQWHREKTSKALGIPLRTLHRKMKNLEIIRRKNP